MVVDTDFIPGEGYDFIRPSAMQIDYIVYIFGYGGGMFMMGGDSDSIVIFGKTNNAITTTTNGLNMHIDITGTSQRVRLKIYKILKG